MCVPMDWIDLAALVRYRSRPSRTVRNSSELRRGRQTQWVRFDRALAGHLCLDVVDDGDEVVAGGAGHAGGESGAVVLRQSGDDRRDVLEGVDGFHAPQLPVDVPHPGRDDVVDDEVGERPRVVQRFDERIGVVRVELGGVVTVRQGDGAGGGDAGVQEQPVAGSGGGSSGGVVVQDEEYLPVPRGAMSSRVARWPAVSALPRGAMTTGSGRPSAV